MADDDKAAQNRLDDAIREFSTASEFDGILTHYVIVMTHATLVDGDDATRYALAYMGDSMPYHTSIGLLEYAKARLLADAMGDRE